MFLRIFDLLWFEHHFLYFAIVGGVYILYLVIKIIIKVDKDIKNMNKKTRDGMVDYMRKTSKYNDDKKRKKLDFNEKD